MKRLTNFRQARSILFLLLATICFSQCSKLPEIQRKHNGPVFSFESNNLQDHLIEQDVRFAWDYRDQKKADSFLVFRCEYVIVWDENASSATRDSVRSEIKKEYGIRATYGCMCDGGQKELWLTKNPIPIQDREARQRPPDPPINEFEPNTVFGTEYFKSVRSVQMNNILAMNLGPLLHQDAHIDIAILDTGFDFENSEYQTLVGGLNLWTNQAEALGLLKTDDDANCLEDDVHGWDFVNNDNQPSDDHSHGTHVTGIIAMELNRLDPTLSYRILPLKTHNERGNGSLFNISCAFDYAINAKVDYINASWGYTGPQDPILQKDIENAVSHGIVIVGAMGNNAQDNAVEPFQIAQHYYNANTVGLLAIGADNNDNDIWAYTNYYSRDTNITALGIDVKSFAPDFIVQLADQMRNNGASQIPSSFPKIKSGTSMSVPKVIGGMVATQAVKTSMGVDDWMDWFISTCTSPYNATTGAGPTLMVRGYRSVLVMPAVGAYINPPTPAPIIPPTPI